MPYEVCIKMAQKQQMFLTFNEKLSKEVTLETKRHPKL